MSLPSGEALGTPREAPNDSVRSIYRLENPVAEDLNYWLARFVAEVRNQGGKPYTPRSIHQILCGLQRHMLSKTRTAPKILDKDDPRFIEFRSAVDNVFRKLRSEGVGTEVRHAPLVTPDEEDKLWESGVLNITTPKGLQRAVFLCGEMFLYSWRAGAKKPGSI